MSIENVDTEIVDLRADTSQHIEKIWNVATGNVSDQYRKDGQLDRAGFVSNAPSNEILEGAMKLAKEVELKLEEKKMAEVENVYPKTERNKRSLDIGIIGVGGGGGQIADAFAESGYDAMCINLTDRDYDHLKNIPRDEFSRVELIVGAGGAGKNPEVGAQAVKEYANVLVKKIQRKFNNKEFIFVACGLGGGTGTLGGVLVAEIAASLSVPVGMIVTLPRDNEGTDEKINCLRGLQEVANYKGIKSIIVIDNQRVSERLKDVQDTNFWAKADREIVHLFDMFNNYSAEASNTAFDAEDYKKCLMTPGFLILGSSHLQLDAIKQGSTEAQLKDAINSIDNGFLATGFDHSSAVRAAGIIVKPRDRDYSHEFEESLFSHIKSEIGAGGLNRGIYTNPGFLDSVMVNTMLAGMKLPEARVQQLVTNAKSEAAEMASKLKERQTSQIKLDITKDIDLISGNGTSGTGQGLGRRR